MNYIEWVDAYFAGELPEAQQQEFEAALTTSPELQAEVALTRKMMAALHMGPPDEAAEKMVGQIAGRHRAERDTLFQQHSAGTLSSAGRVQFEKRLEEDDLFAFEWAAYKRNLPAKAINVQMTWVRWAAAASVLLVLGAIAWWTVQNTNRQNEELLARYDVPELFPSSEYALVDEGLLHKGVIGSDEFEQLKLDGLRAFDAKDWSQAIRLLSEYQQKTKPSAEDTPDEINLLSLYIGRAWYELRKPGKAITALQAGIVGVVDLKNYGFLQEFMRWHLALAHLQNRDPTAAKVQLEILRNARQQDIRQQAIKVLTDLK